MIEALQTAVRSLPDLENVRVTEALMSKRREPGQCFVEECGSRKVKVRMVGSNGWALSLNSSSSLLIFVTSDK